MPLSERISHFCFHLMFCKFIGSIALFQRLLQAQIQMFHFVSPKNANRCSNLSTMMTGHLCSRHVNGRNIGKSFLQRVHQLKISKFRHILVEMHNRRTQMGKFNSIPCRDKLDYLGVVFLTLTRQ